MTSESTCLDAFQRELDYLCRTLRRLGAGPGDIEDLAHEVFLVLYKKWSDDPWKSPTGDDPGKAPAGGYDPARPLRPYLFGIAFRVVSTYRRRQRREIPSESAVDREDSAPRPDQVLEVEQARTLVLQALEQVPLERRAVLIMHDLDEVAMRDIASTLSIPLFTAYSRLRKARKELEAAVVSLQKGRIRR